MLLSREVAFTIFGVDIYWYAVIITSAIILALLLSFILVKKKKLNSDMPMDIFLAIIPLGIIFARLFSVLFSGVGIGAFFQFRDGGLSIIGAVIGGVIGLVILSLIKKKDYNFLMLADLVASVLILAQAIGRWGNFVNQEVYGWQVIDANWQFFPFAVEVGGNWFLALFFYEFVLDLIGAIILLCVYLKSKITGLTTAIYLIYYGLIRLILENFRDSRFILRFLGMPISQVISGIFLISGVAIVVYIIYKAKKLEGNDQNKDNKSMASKTRQKSK